MGNFLTSLFSSSKPSQSAEEQAKNDLKNFDILKYDGVRALRMGKRAYAIKCFTEALQIQDDFETMNYLVSAYSMNSQLDEALEVLDRMVAARPDDVKTLLTRVNLLFLLDKDAEVIPDCERIIELEPENPAAYFQLAKARKATGDAFGAIADLTRAIAIKEDFPEAYLSRAEILLSMGQAKEALPDAEKGVGLAPEEETAYLLRGQIHAALGEAEEAAADFRRTLELNPFNEEASLASGRLLIERGAYDEAIAFFDEAIETNPSFARAYNERGRAKNLKGDKDGAYADLKKSLELDPEGEVAKKLDGVHTNFDQLYKGGIF